MLPGDYPSHLDTDRQSNPHADPAAVRTARRSHRSPRVRAAVVIVIAVVLLALLIWLNSV